MKRSSFKRKLKGKTEVNKPCKSHIYCNPRFCGTLCTAHNDGLTSSFYSESGNKMSYVKVDLENPHDNVFGHCFYIAARFCYYFTSFLLNSRKLQNIETYPASCLLTAFIPLSKKTLLFSRINNHTIQARNAMLQLLQ